MALAGPGKATVVVRVQGLRHEQGLVYVAIYDNPQAFAARKGFVVGKETRPRNGGASVTFEQVPPGRYAAAFYQDENGNQKLDTNLFGIPSEGFGFSKDAMGKLGPPSFEAAALEISAGQVTIVMNAKYF